MYTHTNRTDIQTGSQRTHEVWCKMWVSRVNMVGGVLDAVRMRYWLVVL